MFRPAIRGENSHKRGMGFPLSRLWENPEGAGEGSAVNPKRLRSRPPLRARAGYPCICIWTIMNYGHSDGLLLKAESGFLTFGIFDAPARPAPGGVSSLKRCFPSLLQVGEGRKGRRGARRAPVAFEARQAPGRSGCLGMDWLA